MMALRPDESGVTAPTSTRLCARVSGSARCARPGVRTCTACNGIGVLTPVHDAEIQISEGPEPPPRDGAVQCNIALP
jgi:hypothetical protein